MNIDDLFKIPKLPPGNKRKLPDNPTPEMLKRMKFDSSSLPSPQNGDAPPSGSSSKGKGRAVAMEEVEDEDADGDRVMMGPSPDEGPDRDFAPGGNANYFVEEDDEGRFFGSGLTEEQDEILNIFDRGGGAEDRAMLDAEDLTPTSVRRILLRFERAVDKNTDMRSKYPDDPTKFIDSEADLDLAIKSLLPLAQSPAVAYPELIKSESVQKLVGLLTHENADIVIDAVEVIQELTDEDVGNEADDEEEGVEEALQALIRIFVELSVLELLVDNLSRLNEEEESDRQGVFHILSIFENILGFKPKLSTKIVKQTKIMPWLLNRIQSKKHSENRSYAAEILSILLQDNKSNRLELGKHDGIETILKVLSRFRKTNPVDADETEFMENIFDALCSALYEQPVKDLFLKAEGPDLMVLMMKEKMQSRSRSIKTLDYAMSGTSSFQICINFIEAAGLKTLFSIFMNKSSTSSKQRHLQPASEDINHVLGILSSLLSRLAPESPERTRLLAKFVENDYEKVDKLLEIRDNARNLLKKADQEIEAEKRRKQGDGEGNDGEDEDEDGGLDEDGIYLRRLDGGLFTLQVVDYILAWIIMEDDGIGTHALHLLSRRNQSIPDIITTLRIYHDNMDESASLPTGDDSDEEDEDKSGKRKEKKGVKDAKKDAKKEEKDDVMMDDEDRPPTQKEILASLIAAYSEPAGEEGEQVSNAS